MLHPLALSEHPAPKPPNWLLTTCRGRVAHLREALPTWLDLLPDWSPLVICCDDRAAFDYASGELFLAGRGAAVYTSQGEWFSRLEAIRLGLYALEEGTIPDGRAFELQLPREDAPIKTLGRPHLRGKIAIFDADTIALSMTGPTMSRVDQYAAGIAQSCIRDDMGFLLCAAEVLQYAVNQIERNAFNGYGFEDSALRVGAWHATNGAFMALPHCWARKVHNDAARDANYRQPMKLASQANAKALGSLITRLIEPSKWVECCNACLPGQKFDIRLPQVSP